MTDPAPGVGSAAPLPAGGRDGYNATKDVALRARTTRWEQDAQTRAAVERMSARLASGEPLRRDVPPGFYLDIRL
jgi:hypothetical protein